MSPTGPGLSQAASCLASAPHYPHVHFSRHVIGLIYTEPKWHKQLIDTAHTGLHMDPIGAACLMLADGKVRYSSSHTSSSYSETQNSLRVLTSLTAILS